MLDLMRQLLPDVIAVELQHGSGRVRHLRITTADGRTRPCVLRQAPSRELALHQSYLRDPAAGAPALMGAAPADSGEVYLLLEAFPEQFPDFANPADVAACYAHLGRMHAHFTNLDAVATGPWAITASEIAAVLMPNATTAPLAAEAAALLTEGPPTLVHGDYHRWNLLLIDGPVRVLDWEQASIAVPWWDLALLAPDEPGWDGAPRGVHALLALQKYYEAGPLARLSWNALLRRQSLARLFVAARWAQRHAAKAAAMPPGEPRRQIEAHAAREAVRIQALLTHLENPAGHPGC